MESRNVTDTQSERSEKVLAYRYHAPCIAMHGGEKSIVEYFVPSENMRINKYGVVWAMGPNNTLKLQNHANSKALNKVWLSKALVKDIRMAIDEDVPVPADLVNSSLKNNEEYKNLFVKKKVPTHEVLLKADWASGYAQVKDDLTLWQKAEIKGHDPIIKALSNYILNGNLPENVKMDEVMEYIKCCDQFELKSIIDSIQINLKSVNGKFTQQRNEELVKATHSILSPKVESIVVGTATTFTAKMLDVDTSYAAGFGLFSAAVIYGGKKLENHYTKARVNKLWDQREAREQEVLGQLQAHFPVNSSKNRN